MTIVLLLYNELDRARRYRPVLKNVKERPCRSHDRNVPIQVIGNVHERRGGLVGAWWSAGSW